MSIRAALYWGAVLYQQGHYPEARELIETGIARAETADLLRLAALGRQYAGGVAYYLADYERSQREYKAALAYYEPFAPDFPRQRAGLLNNLGNVALRREEYERAKWYYERAFALRQAEDESSLGGVVTINNLGLVALRQGDWPGARAHFEQALRLYRQAGNRQGESMVLGNMADLHLALGEYGRARQLAEEDMAIMQAIGRHGRLGVRLIRLATICQRQERLEEAQQYAEQGLTAAQTSGEADLIAKGAAHLEEIQAAMAEAKVQPLP